MNKNINRDYLFWNVDTQYDFMRKGQPLYVEGAESIEEKLTALTWYAREHNYRIINTADWHTLEDDEINDIDPDYKTTFPSHCMVDSDGAEFIPATRPVHPYVIDDVVDFEKLEDSAEIVIHKNKFDVYQGNSLTQSILDKLRPRNILVYGVASNVCVDQAIQGHLANNNRVYVAYDAIKELPVEHQDSETTKQQIYAKWRSQGVRFKSVNDLLFPGGPYR